MLIQLETEKGVPASSSLGLEPRYTRRLSDKLAIAFYAACDIGNLESATHLLAALEFEVIRSMRLRQDAREDGNDLDAIRARLALERRKMPEKGSFTS